LSGEYLQGILGASGVIASLAVVVIGNIKQSRDLKPKRQAEFAGRLVGSLLAGVVAIYSALTSLVNVDSTSSMRCYAVVAAISFAVQLCVFLSATLPYWLNWGEPDDASVTTQEDGRVNMLTKEGRRLFTERVFSWAKNGGSAVITIVVGVPLLVLGFLSGLVAGLCEIRKHRQ
jgi:hypothetical protein